MSEQLEYLDRENRELKRKVRESEDRLLDVLRQSKRSRPQFEDTILGALRECKGKGSLLDEYCRIRETGQEMEERAFESDVIDIGDKEMTLEKTLKFLKEEGFKRFSQNDNLNTGDFSLLIIPDMDSDPSVSEYNWKSTAKRVRDLGYQTEKYESESNIHNSIGCILCGGLYTGMTIFEGEINITKKEGKRNVGFSHFVPRGSMLVRDGLGAIDDKMKRIEFGLDD